MLRAASMLSSISDGTFAFCVFHLCSSCKLSLDFIPTYSTCFNISTGTNFFFIVWSPNRMDTKDKRLNKKHNWIAPKRTLKEVEWFSVKKNASWLSKRETRIKKPPKQWTFNTIPLWFNQRIFQREIKIKLEKKQQEQQRKIISFHWDQKRMNFKRNKRT